VGSGDGVIVTVRVGSALACNGVPNLVVEMVCGLLSTQVADTVSINEPKYPKITSRTITSVRRYFPLFVFERERGTDRTCVAVSWIARCCMPVSRVLMFCILIRFYALQNLPAKSRDYCVKA